MYSNVTLRPIAAGDLEWARGVRNQNRHCFFDSSFIDKRSHDQWFQKLNYPFFVIEYCGSPVGTIGVKNAKDGSEIRNVVIESHMRKKGILRDVLEILETRFQKPFFLEVVAQNTDAIAAYQKLGFTVISHRMEKP